MIDHFCGYTLKYEREMINWIHHKKCSKWYGKGDTFSVQIPTKNIIMAQKPQISVEIFIQNNNSDEID